MSQARITALYQYPLKSFTPQRVARVTLEAGEHFPGDRLYAVENGPSGFDAAAPEYLSKTKFVVLARMAEIARIRSHYDMATGRLSARRDGLEDFEGDLDDEKGRGGFTEWLGRALAEVPHHPLTVLRAPRHHAFMDDGGGFVSVINLASVRDLEAKIGRRVDPLRFRANIYVEGWPAWAELDMSGATLDAGEARLEGVEPIARCTATHVDPSTGERDIDVVQALMTHFGHRLCGLYLKVIRGGGIAGGDPVRRAPV